MKSETLIILLVVVGLGGVAFFLMRRQTVAQPQALPSQREVPAAESGLGDQIGAAATGIGNSIDSLAKIFGGF